MGIWQEDRLYPNLNAGSCLGALTQELHGVASLCRNGNIAGIHGVDPLNADLVEVHTGVISQTRQESNLAGCVKTAHIIGWVGFGIALFLGHRQGMVIGPAILGHVAEHVVGGSIENPHDARNLVGG